MRCCRLLAGYDPSFSSRARAVRVAAQIASEMGISYESILGRCREARLVAARHRLCAVLRAEGMSLSEIGRSLGLHHTSVLHAVRKYARAS